jgi:hypothetical protein
MSNLFSFMQVSDNIVISCTESVLNAYVPDLLFEGENNNFFAENLLINLLYNIGFQFTDILDLIFIENNLPEPFWYYVFYKIGDFVIRFIFRDEDPE